MLSLSELWPLSKGFWIAPPTIDTIIQTFTNILPDHVVIGALPRVIGALLIRLSASARFDELESATESSRKLFVGSAYSGCDTGVLSRRVVAHHQRDTICYFSFFYPDLLSEVHNRSVSGAVPAGSERGSGTSTPSILS